ncbi:MAG: hypothetical protein VKP62_08825 [Candidatus Sericytochromatia bacterium]|nr:hypothetical protein [Candidatus Sericytochromatia bacterium]
MLWRMTLLAAACLTPFEAAWAGAVSAQVDERQAADAFATLVRDACASGEAARVRVVVPEAGPLADWLSTLWQEMRRGHWAPRSWAARFEPFYVRGDAMGGLLTLGVEASDGTLRQRAFPLVARRRGAVWLAAGELQRDRPDLIVKPISALFDLREAGRLRGQAHFEARQMAAERGVYFSLDPALRVTSVMCGERRLSFRQLEDTVFLEWPEGETEVVLSWEGALASLQSGFVPDRVLQLPAAQAWWPRPLGGLASERLEWQVMLPPTWLALAPGSSRTSEHFRDGWLHRFQQVVTSSEAGLLLGDWAHQERRDQGVSLEVYARAGHEPGAALVAREGEAIAGFLMDWLNLPDGAPWTFWETAASEVGLVGQTLALPASAFEYEEVRQAQLAPAMTRAMLAPLSVLGTAGERGWLTDGLAAYLAAIYSEHRWGKAAFREQLLAAYRREVAAPVTEETPAIRDVKPTHGVDTWQRLVADRGMLIFHMLRTELGEVPFQRAVQAWRAGPSDRVDLRSLDTLVAACSKQRKGDWGPFLRQWLTRADRPEVQISQVQLKRQGRLWALQGLISQAGEPFSFRLPLVLSTAGRPRIYHMAITTARTEFVLLSPDRPRILRVDPLHETLAISPGAWVISR